jgi:hypothetical protein
LISGVDKRGVHGWAKGLNEAMLQNEEKFITSGRREDSF